MHLKSILTNKKILILTAISLLVIVSVGRVFFARKKIATNKSLIPSLSNNTKINPSQIEAVKAFEIYDVTAIDAQTFIGIDKEFRLSKISSQGRITLLPQVLNYSYTPSSIAALRKNNTQTITLVDNKDTSKITNLNIRDQSPPLSVGLDPNGKFLYFLGKYDPISRRSKLYFVDMGNNQQKLPLIDTTADKIEIVDEKHLLFFETADAPDSSTISVFDTDQKQFTFSVKGNHYRLSPSHKLLAVTSSNSAIIYNLDNSYRKSLSLKEGTLLVWKNDHILAGFINNYPGVELQYIDIDTSQKSDFAKIDTLKSTSISQIYAVASDTAYVKDANGLLWQITLP